MKILNLYAGIGGNRKLWKDADVTAVEIDPEIARVYSDYFPQDKMIVGDAHQYLLEHFDEYDFIWSSPPCQSHSSFRFNIGVRFRGVKPVYPDMTLYQEIILLENYYKGKYVVENVNPYYQPLIKPSIMLQRHLFWTNFPIEMKEFKKEKLRSIQIPQLEELYGYDLSGYKLKNKRQVLRNCVTPEVGEYIYNHA